MGITACPREYRNPAVSAVSLPIDYFYAGIIFTVFDQLLQGVIGAAVVHANYFIPAMKLLQDVFQPSKKVNQISFFVKHRHYNRYFNFHLFRET
jgi:hypothetical protein